MIPWLVYTALAVLALIGLRLLWQGRQNRREAGNHSRVVIRNLLSGEKATRELIESVENLSGRLAVMEAMEAERHRLEVERRRLGNLAITATARGEWTGTDPAEGEE